MSRALAMQRTIVPAPERKKHLERARMRRTYYLFQMPRWDRRLRMVLDWTVALFFRPDITRVDLRVEREQVNQARQFVEKSSEVTRPVQTESAFRAIPAAAIRRADEGAGRMHIS